MFISAAVDAADYPTSAFFYGADGLDSLTIQCSYVSDSEITCQFAQARIKKATEEDLPSLLSNVDRKLRDEKFESPKDCDGVRQIVTSLKSTQRLRDVDQQQNLAATSGGWGLADSIDYYEAMSQYCDDPILETYKRFLAADHGIKARTCKIVPIGFTQEFRLTNGSSWVGNSGPHGVCGTVLISSLQKAKDDSSFWTYTTQKVITNKNSDLCQGFDEDSHLYDWKVQTIALHCDYITFGF